MVTDEPDSAQRGVVVEGLLAFNVPVIGPPEDLHFGVFARDESGVVRGGLLAQCRWGWMYVEKFWLPAEMRGLGTGTALLHAAEQRALEHGCHGAYLDTFEYQALPFYLKQGYALFGTLEGYPPGFRQYYVSKRLR